MTTLDRFVLLLRGHYGNKMSVPPTDRERFLCEAVEQAIKAAETRLGHQLQQRLDPTRPE